MNRRAFLSMISAGLAAAADPERLLWVPGRKLISIPKPRPIPHVLVTYGWSGGILKPGDIVTFPASILPGVSPYTEMLRFRIKAVHLHDGSIDLTLA